mgnify:CR=1 FL=1|jgi:hypothetical protein
MIKTKFYFYDNNQIKSKEDYLTCKLKSGKSHINIETDDDILNNRITNKFIKFGIYHSNLINDNKGEDFLLFNKEQFCQLLYKNVNILELSKPGMFSKKIKYYINQLDSIIYELTQYFVTSLLFEKDIIQNIEYYRINDINICKQLSQLFVDYRNFIFNLRIVIYDELINFYQNFKNIECNLKNDKNNILVDINDFISTEKKYLMFNDNFESNINFYDNRFIVTDFSDHDKVKKFINDFDIKSKSAFNEIII